MASSSLHPHPSTLPFYPSISTPSNSSLLHINFRCRTLKPTCCLSIHQSSDSRTDTNLENDKTLRIVFAAGGTGGHICPAVAIADELKIINPKTQILFIGSQNGMESTSVPYAGYDFVSVPTTVPLFRPIFSPQNLLLPYRLIKSLIQCHSIIKNFNPHIVVGTGGYVSFPICLSAALQRIKLVIQEQNSVPGIANWVLSFFAHKVFVAFDSTIECFPRKDKCVACGNPVRLSLRTYVSKVVARLNFFPRLKKEDEANARVVLVLGGSLGANAVNIAMLNLYYQMLMEKHNLFIIWQTGVEAFNEMESLVRNHPRLLLTPFLHSMDLAYAAADLIVSRAGAMTCYEILATGKPSILIPSPNVAEGHQFKNASLMAKLADSRIITEDELDSITLETTIEEILGNEALMAEMSERALKAAKPGASADIAQHILSLVES
ncbi:glycosyltransferase [Citrus sinensis]|uniref:Glycosyltransferase family 28 N-terminal domain-containing protein n=2 Tax=Citrus TaxID=2706 RepID=V4TVR6_CITCL|nr:uncharacterized protein LOC18049220 [Citrus x clementina]XP_006477770.2 uncharacterized protein LOC102629761 [Citrus sinensis]ESR55815.1 hypothetical protein CICLE_v10020201mg [Citrus x clementina]KAH9722880.1 glycosyltransferase [Citrus sinensis]